LRSRRRASVGIWEQARARQELSALKEASLLLVFGSCRFASRSRGGSRWNLDDSVSMFVELRKTGACAATSERDWNAVSCFFDYWQHLFEFSEVFEDGYASLGYGEYCSVFSNGSYFNEVLLSQEVQVFFQDLAVNICFIHYVRQF
jgi:hypothetical protein